MGSCYSKNMAKYERKLTEKGQILLIVVLASVISLTVGLAAISRSVTNNRVSTEESNSQKALSAAEAGIEEQINKLNSTQGSTGSDRLESDGEFGELGNKSEFSAVAIPVGGEEFEINGGQAVSQDEGADVWLSAYPTFNPSIGNTTLAIFWNAPDSSNCANIPAIEVAVISGSLDNPNMERYAADSCTTRRTSQNNFDADNNSGCSSFPYPTGYNRRYCISIDQGRIARIIPLYANAKIAVSSSPIDLPAQGYTIDSTGQSGTTVRKVRVFQGFPKLPVEFFPYNLFVPR